MAKKSKEIHAAIVAGILGHYSSMSLAQRAEIADVVTRAVPRAVMASASGVSGKTFKEWRDAPGFPEERNGCVPLKEYLAWFEGRYIGPDAKTASTLEGLRRQVEAVRLRQILDD